MEPKIRERPILFSAPMVRAILAGTKTQTRRIVKPQPIISDVCGAPMWTFARERAQSRLIWPNAREQVLALCPHGQPGDRLWVRESVRAADLDDFSRAVEYLADGACVRVASAEDIESEAFGRWERLNSYRSNDAALDGGKTIPPMHMPRWASRIDLEITGIRVERLNAISEADCWAEGIEEVMNDFPDESQYATAKRLGASIEDAKPLYCQLWESINGAGSWDANPWVWVVKFRRL